MTRTEEMPPLARVANIKPLELATTKKAEVPNFIAAMGVLFREMAHANGKHAEQKSREASNADLATRAQHNKQSKRHKDSGFYSFYSKTSGVVIQLGCLAFSQRTGMTADATQKLMHGASFASSGAETLGGWYAKGHEGEIDGKGRGDTEHAQSLKQTANASLIRTVDSAHGVSQLATQAFAAAAAAYRS